jgi:hypothetical protein
MIILYETSIINIIKHFFLSKVIYISSGNISLLSYLVREKLKGNLAPLKYQTSNIYIIWFRVSPNLNSKYVYYIFNKRDIFFKILQFHSGNKCKCFISLEDNSDIHNSYT